MSKKKEIKTNDAVYVAKTGGNLSDGTRFEAGDILDTNEVTAPDIAALLEMGALEAK